MEIERTNSQTASWAYTLSTWERKLIAKAIKPEIKKLEKKIVALEEHPDNEGQVKYQVQIEQHRSEIITIEGIIKEFSE